MQSSLHGRLVGALGAALLVGLVSSGYILGKFRGYEQDAIRVMSGDQKSVLMGHLVAAKVRAAEELAQASANSEDANDAFREKVQSITEDVRTLAKDRPEKALEDAKRILMSLVTTKSDAMEDLFIHYRNIKTSAFNIYRTAWNNKWMNVARSAGLIINDLDNFPYHAGEKAAASAYSKLESLAGLVTTSQLPQNSKLLLLGQLSGLKAQIARYTEAVQRSAKTRGKRIEDLRALSGILKRNNEVRGKGIVQFGDEAHGEVLKALMAFLLFVLFAVGWYLLMTRRFYAHVTKVAAHASRQLGGWITAGGNIGAQGFKVPERPDAELAELYQILDQTMRRVHSLRKEDILVKRLLNVPFILINRNREAIFWNSALTILGRVRALEETGAVNFTNLVRFTTAQGQPVDPIEKALVDNKEISQLALLRVADDGVAVHVVCTPVLGPDHQAEYVMVHLRDLREENRRAETELDRQLDPVRAAVAQVKLGRVPIDPPAGSRRPVTESVAMLKHFALELQERASVMAGQVETMWGRMAREAGLKKTVHGRMEQLRDEVEGVRMQLVELRNHAEGVAARMVQVEVRGQKVRSEYDDIRRRGTELYKDLKTSQDLIGACLARLSETEEISGRVRANERMIRSILEKSSLLNANNSILGSRRELSPTDVVTITENITQLMGQFERSYRFIEQSVEDVERGLHDLAGKLRDNLSECIRLAGSDEEILKTINGSEQAVETASREVADLARAVGSLKGVSGRIALSIQGVESKLQRLSQIGQASLDLQSQLELGFKGMFGTMGRAPEPKEPLKAPGQA